MGTYEYIMLFMALVIIFQYHSKKKLHIDNNTLRRQIETLENQNQQLLNDINVLQKHFDKTVEQKITEKVCAIRFKPQYESIPIFRNFSEIPMHDGRFMRSIKEEMYISDFTASALITSESKNTYHTTLTQCSCMDFKIKGNPCKHMYRLATELGLVIGSAIEDNNYIKNLYLKELQLTKAKATFEKEKADFRKNFEKEKAESRKNFEKEKSDFQKIMTSKKQNCPFLVNLFADYYYLQDLELANYLMYKSPPAVKAAENVKTLAGEKKKLLQQLKLAEYQLNFYESLFPWLLDFKELSPEDACNIISESAKDSENEYAHFKKYLSPMEFNQLSHTEKLQLSLDRYKSRNKTNWDIGIEYERYVGYLYEKDGYTVQYTGALEGVKDMGRDLIVKSKNNVEIIQCKRWAQEKTIHEKHVFQLYGSVVLYQIQYPKKEVFGVFYTTTSLSETAKECANFLGIKYYENFQYQDHPLIKCNISRSREKIYHLPFDQMYDKTFITPSNGDFYVNTVEEAENLGFRHAYKWKPETVQKG